jgi:enoyl-CoA hydratase/carnithine racemase
MAEELVHLEQRGNVLLITLDRPEKMNALNAEMMAALETAWQRLRDDDGLLSAIVTGAGDRAFCSGRDLFAGAPGSIEYHRAQQEVGANGRRNERRWAPTEVWKPVIAAVNGYALAGGFALALACDFRIAASGARLGSLAVKRNLLGAGQIVRLTRYVPFAKALEIVLLGDHISAEEAQAIGLVNAVVPQAQLLDTAFAWAEKLAKNGPLSVRASKEVAYKSLELPYSEAARFEASMYERMLETEDVVEGHAAFRERREPVWKGR